MHEPQKKRSFRIFSYSKYRSTATEGKCKEILHTPPNITYLMPIHSVIQHGPDRDKTNPGRAKPNKDKALWTTRITICRSIRHMIEGSPSGSGIRGDTRSGAAARDRVVPAGCLNGRAGGGVLRDGERYTRRPPRLAEMTPVFMPTQCMPPW